MDQIDSLYIIEQELYKARMMSAISLKEIKASAYKVDLDAIYNIERHREYMIDSLIRYVKILGKHLFLADQPISDLSDIGRLLKQKRAQAGLSLIAAYSESKVLPKSISKIEQGKNYRKTTLVNYLSYYHLHFSID